MQIQSGPRNGCSGKLKLAEDKVISLRTHEIPVPHSTEIPVGPSVSEDIDSSQEFLFTVRQSFSGSFVHSFSSINPLMEIGPS